MSPAQKRTCPKCGAECFASDTLCLGCGADLPALGGAAVAAGGGSLTASEQRVGPKVYVESPVFVSPDLRHVVHKSSRVVLVDGRVSSSDLDAIGDLAVSASGAQIRVAHAGRRGEPDPLLHLEPPWFLIVDGEENPQEHAFVSDPRFSPDGKRLAYVAWEDTFRDGGGYLKPLKPAAVIDGRVGPTLKDIHLPVFSGDSAHCAYAGESEGQWRVFADGAEVAHYQYVSELQYGPEGNDLVYAARLPGRDFVVRNGQEGPPYPSVRNLQFSPDGSRFVYQAKREGGECVVVNGTEGPLFSEITGALGDTSPESLVFGHVLFSPDSRLLAYVARAGSDWHLVVNEHLGPPCQEIGTAQVIPGEGGAQVRRCLFSPDCRNVAWLARHDKQWTVVVNGKPLGSACEEVRGLWFAPDSRHLTWQAREGKQWCAVMDGKARPPCDEVQYVRCSPDGRRLAFAARKGRGWRVVVEGEQLPISESADIQDLRFSPDGRHLAFARQADNGWRLVVDGQQSAAYSSVQGLQYLADGRLLAIVGDLKWLTHVVVDGWEGPPCESIVTNRVVQDQDSLVYLAKREDGFFRITLR